MRGDFGGFVRAWAIALVALLVWFFAEYQGNPHRVAEVTAPSDSFSSARAENVLATILGPEIPHPVGSAENARVRARVIAEFAKLGVQTKTYRAFACGNGRLYVPCATVTDIIADVVPGEGKAIVLLAHYDSVPAGPGASDDESSVATILEAVRALKARGGNSRHPILAVITDGEEAGLLGANAFLQNADLRGRVGAVVNVEARGTRGPSLLFQTSPGDGPLIDLYAANVSVYATSSLYAEIYKVLPNDTDLTLFIARGFPSFNFAFADNVRYYHSPLDTRADLNPATLQMQGDNLLGVAEGLEKTEFAALKGTNDVYITMFGAFLPRTPASWALPLSIIAFVALAIAAWLARSGEALGARRMLAAAAMPLALIVGAGLFGWLLSELAQIVSGHPDPSYAYPWALRVALAFGVWAVTLLVARMARIEAAAASSWLWMSGLGVLVAAFLPGFSPYFVFPSLVAALLLLIATAAPGRWKGAFGSSALLLSALGAFFVWIPLVASGETIMGLRLHPLFTIPAAFAMMTAVPLIAARPMARSLGNASVALSFAVAVALALVAGFLPAYSALSPQRVDLIYFESGKAEAARWIATTSWKGIGTEPIPAQLKNAGPFALNPDAWAGLLPGDAYTAPAGAPLYPSPTAQVVSDKVEGAGRSVEIRLDGSGSASGMAMYIPRAAGLEKLQINGQDIVIAQHADDTRIVCSTPDCRDLDVKLVLTNKGALSIPFAEFRYDLPPAGARLVAARPATAMASQSGDEIFLANAVKLAAR